LSLSASADAELHALVRTSEFDWADGPVLSRLAQTFSVLEKRGLVSRTSCSPQGEYRAL